MKLPEILIEHALPHRVRLRFALPPQNPGLLGENVINLEGVEDFAYTPLTRSAVIAYQSERVQLTTILKTMARQLTLENDRQPVSIRTNCGYLFTPLSLLSAGSILVAGAATALSLQNTLTTLLRWSAVVFTAGAIMEHASGEIRRAGSFDFENLSIVYLINSLSQNHLVRGAFATWLATFSRHLMPFRPQEGMKLQLIEGRDQQSGSFYQDFTTTGNLDLGCLNLNGQPNATNPWLRGIALASWKGIFH